MRVSIKMKQIDWQSGIHVSTCESIESIWKTWKEKYFAAQWTLSEMEKMSDIEMIRNFDYFDIFSIEMDTCMQSGASIIGRRRHWISCGPKLSLRLYSRKGEAENELYLQLGWYCKSGREWKKEEEGMQTIFQSPRKT